MLILYPVTAFDPGAAKIYKCNNLELSMTRKKCVCARVCGCGFEEVYVTGVYACIFPKHIQSSHFSMKKNNVLPNYEHQLSYITFFFFLKPGKNALLDCSHKD